jgi:hypothetical protein
MTTAHLAGLTHTPFIGQSPPLTGLFAMDAVVH